MSKKRKLPSSKEKVIQSEFNGRLVQINVKVGDKWGQYEANELKNELSKKVLKFYSDSIVSCKIVDFYKIFDSLISLVWLNFNIF